MNKTIIININSIVFHIEEDAYEVLRSYMIEIKRHFGRTPDSGEILQDIENRIAEMFAERIEVGKKEVISMIDVEEVIAQMGRVSDFEDVDELSDETYDDHQARSKEEKHAPYGHKKIMRDPDDTIIGGVCSGLGHYLGMDVKWVRVLFVLFFLFGGSGILLYVVLWALMPVASSRADKMAMRGEEPTLQNFKKSFEDDLENYSQGFTHTKGFVSRNSRAIGDVISAVFRFIGKLFALFMLIISGLTIMGLIFMLVAFSLGVLGYQNEIIFPPLEALSKDQALIALLAGVLGVMIPFMALFHLFVRILFKTRPMNTYLSLSLWAIWVVSVIVLIVYIIVGNQNFKETSTIKVEKPVPLKSVYHFTEKDLRIIDAATLENGQKEYRLRGNTENFSRAIRNDISVRFEPLDSLQKPFVQYHYTARGKTYQQAAERAAKIDYEMWEEKDKMIFDSHFKLEASDPYRGQEVAAVVFLPLGTVVEIGEPLRAKLRGISYRSCLQEAEGERKAGKTVWVMQKSGLICATPNEQ